MADRTIKSDFYYSSAMIVAATAAGIAQVAALWLFVGINSRSDPFFVALVAFQTINAIAIAARGPIIGRLTPIEDDRAWVHEGVRIATASGIVVAVIALVALVGGMIFAAARDGVSVIDVAARPLPVNMYLMLGAGVLAATASCLTGLLVSRLHFRATALSYVGSACVTIVLTFALCPVLGEYGAAIAAFCAMTVLLVWNVILVRGHRHAAFAGAQEPADPDWHTNARHPAGTLGRFFYEAIAISGVSGSWQVCVLIASAWVARYLEGGAASFFNIGVGIPNILTAATAGALMYVLLPHAVAAKDRGDMHSRRNIVVDAIKHPLVIVVPLPICIALVTGDLAQSVTFAKTVSLTHDYLMMVAVLSIGAIVQTFATSMAVIAITDRRWAMLLVSGGVTIVLAAALLNAVMPAGVIGAAALYVLAIAIGSGLLFGVMAGREAPAILGHVVPRLAVLAVLAAAAGLLGRLVMSVEPTSLALAVIGALAVIAAYLVLVVLVLPEYRGLVRGEGLRPGPRLARRI